MVNFLKCFGKFNDINQLNVSSNFNIKNMLQFKSEDNESIIKIYCLFGNKQELPIFFVVVGRHLEKFSRSRNLLYVCGFVHKKGMIL